MGQGEANPDVYVVLKNEVRGSATGDGIVAKHGDDSPYNETTWRDGESGFPEAYVANECSSGSNCNINFLTPLVPTSVVTSEKSIALMILDSSQRTLEAFMGSMNGGGTITVEVDQNADLSSSCPTGCAESPTRYRIPTDQGIQLHGDLPTHEVGHVLQMREFNGQNDLIDNLMKNDSGGWTLWSNEWNSASTTEGWATYVAMVSWYDSENSSTIPLFLTQDMEDASPKGGTCALSATMPGQVAKAFWDLDDVHNEVGTGHAAGEDDLNDLSRDFLLNQWDDFPDGTSNREDYEGHVDGVNVWDYRVNAPIGDEETFIRHNCLSSQNPN